MIFIFVMSLFVPPTLSSAYVPTCLFHQAASRSFNVTVVVALLQPPPEVLPCDAQSTAPCGLVCSMPHEDSMQDTKTHTAQPSVPVRLWRDARISCMMRGLGGLSFIFSLVFDDFESGLKRGLEVYGSVSFMHMLSLSKRLPPLAAVPISAETVLGAVPHAGDKASKSRYMSITPPRRTSCSTTSASWRREGSSTTANARTSCPTSTASGELASDVGLKHKKRCLSARLVETVSRSCGFAVE